MIVAALVGPGAEALFTAATILWILLPALAIRHLAPHTGAVDVLHRALTHLFGGRRIVSLLVAWFFALLVEGAATDGCTDLTGLDLSRAPLP